MPQGAQLSEARGVQLVHLANDKSRQGRALLTTAIVELFSEEARFFTETDHKMMTEIIISLVGNVETSVKQALAERLSKIPDVPRDLAVHFANMDSSIAFPVLRDSRVLNDPDLIDIVLHKTMEHQMAVSMRAMIPGCISEVLAESQHEEVVKSLLENPGAEIDTSTFEVLAARTTEDTIFNSAMVSRKDLPKAVASQLYWAVSAALRQDLVSNCNLDKDSLDDAIEDIIPQMIGAIGSDEGPEADITGQVEIVIRKGVLGKVLLTLLQSADISRFTTWCAVASHLREDLVRKIMFEEGGECLAAIFKAIGVDRDEFLEIFVLLRQGRLGEKKMPEGEVVRVADFYTEVKPDKASALLKRLQRNPEYLNAIRRLDVTRH